MRMTVSLKIKTAAMRGGRKTEMKLKQSVKVIISVILIAAAFSVSYKLTLSSERKKLAENALRFAQPVAGDLLISEAAATEPPTEPADEQSPTAAEAADRLPDPIIVNMPSDDTWSLVMLNKYYKMNDTYEPHLDECLENTSVYLDKRVAEKFIEMYNAALESGVTLTPASGYVSPDRQKRSFDKQVEAFVADGYTEEKAESLASFTVLPVGCSEHNYGLAVDIGHRSADFADTPAYAWLKEHAAEYGFIERYVSEKENVTHFNAAPWHWRYVGTAAAKEMNGKGVCLEEYVGRVN